MIIVDELSRYIAEDNNDALRIYNELVSCYQKTSSDYAEEVNLLGIYFVELLKFLTQTHFKKKEISKGIQPKDSFVIRRLESWPYLGYDDLMASTPIPKKNTVRKFLSASRFPEKP